MLYSAHHRWMRGRRLAALGAGGLLVLGCRDKGGPQRPTEGWAYPSPVAAGSFEDSLAHDDDDAFGDIESGVSAVGDLEAGVYVDLLSAPASPTLELADFSGAQLCRTCHARHYAEWQRSAHGYSMQDPVYRALVHRQRSDLGVAQDLFCTQCHTAIGTRSGDVVPGFSFDALQSVTQEGVTCEGCHRVTDLERSHNSGHVITPSAPLQGPYADPLSPHAVAQSPVLGTSAFCGGCHDVRDPKGLSLESPFVEWTSSPAAAEGRHCQSCHMPSYAGNASNMAGSPAREVVHRHTFTGVEVPFAALAELDADELALMREQSHELLRGAVSIELDAPGAPAPGTPFEIRVTVKNHIDGHNFPTGSTFNRQFWLALEVLDADGKSIFASGGLDAAGDLFDRHSAMATSADPDLVTFGSWLEDQSGNPTLFSWRAAKVHTTHILAPLGTESIPFQFELPADAVLPLFVNARIRFRAFAPRLLRELDLGHLLPTLEVVDIAQRTVVVGMSPVN